MFDKQTLGDCLNKTCMRFGTNHKISDMIVKNYNGDNVKELWYIGKDIMGKGNNFPYTSIDTLVLSPEVETI